MNNKLDGMLPYTIEMNGVTKAMIWTDIGSVEESAYKQVIDIALHPRLFKHASFMPDIHAGVGVPIGTVAGIIDALIPECVGVDIGCGMCAVRTNLMDLPPDTIKSIHDMIVERIPTGHSHRSAQQMKDVERFSSIGKAELQEDYQPLDTKENDISSQIGTLGGGNHFIELQKDDHGFIWIMIHSGSRNYGYGIANKFIALAKAECKDKLLPELRYLDVSDPIGAEYILAMEKAMSFAKNNRDVMMSIIKDVISQSVEKFELPAKFADVINIHHNYAALENHFGEYVWVHRKGATKVTPKITGIIPGSMGSPSYIVRGRQTTETRLSYNSCSHGAGRTMSRGNAKKNLSIEEFADTMNGVYSTSIDNNHLDESPLAYKDIDDVISKQSGLVEVITKLTPIMNIKG